MKKLKTCEREKGIATHAILLSIAWEAWDLNWNFLPLEGQKL
jgi:hypothetical protein